MSAIVRRMLWGKMGGGAGEEWREGGVRGASFEGVFVAGNVVIGPIILRSVCC